MSNIIRKIFNTTITSVDDAKREITFCFSDDRKDRMGERVDQASWKTDSYEENPLILWGHNPDEPENVLGSGVQLSLDDNGKSYVRAQFADLDENDKADRVYKQVKNGRIRCVSAGFIAHSIEYDDDNTPVLKDCELLEISIVAIPANPRAFALGLRDGSLNTKDAKFLLDSMHKESEFLEEQLKSAATLEAEEVDVDELKAQVAAILSAVTKVTETVADLSDKVDSVIDKGEEEPATPKPAAPAAKDEDQDDPAKGGDNDQPGAGDEDDFDPDAEVSAELEAELEAQAETALAGEPQE